MKTATKIVGIVWAVCLGITALIFLILAVTAFGSVNNDEMIASVMQSAYAEGNYISVDDAKNALAAVGVIFLVAAIWAVVGIVFAIMITVIASKNPVSKTKAIVFGVLGIVFSGVAPGVLSIVLGVTQGE